jgi:hypothetical protein
MNCRYGNVVPLAVAATRPCFSEVSGVAAIVDSQGRAHNTRYGLDRRSSPSITALPGGGFEIAVQVNNHALWTVSGTTFLGQRAGRRDAGGNQPEHQRVHRRLSRKGWSALAVVPGRSGGVGAAGGHGPAGDAGCELLDGPAGGLLRAVMPPASGGEVALVGRTVGPRDGVV